jgi:hypothetical protein
VATIGGSPFSISGFTSGDGANCVICEFVFVRLGQIVCCFGVLSSIRIPSAVRGVGESAFACVNSMVDLDFEEGLLCVFSVQLSQGRSRSLKKVGPKDGHF